METPIRKRLSVLLIAIFIAGAAWGGIALLGRWKARQSLHAAEKALTEGDLTKAQEQLTKYLRARPKDSSALLLAARTARRLGDLQSFQQYLEACEEIQDVTPA